MKKLCLLSFFGVLFLTMAFPILGQTISGPASAIAGNNVNYSLNDDQIFASPSWEVTNGSIVTSSQSGLTYYVTVLWQSSGSQTLSFKNWGSVVSQRTVSVTCPKTLGVPNTTFTYASSCSTITITRNSNPSTNLSWYWQTSSSGQSTALGNGTTLSVSDGGIYYLRTNSNLATGCWSNNSQAAVEIPLNPSVTNGSICEPGTVALYASAGSNSVRWYTVCSGGSVVYTGIGYSPTISSTTTYYACAYNSVTGRESKRIPVTATLHPLPAQPSSASVSPTSICGTGSSSVSLSATGAGAGESYVWYMVQTGGSPLGATTQLVSSTSTFWVAKRTDATGCESARISTTVTVTANSPASISISTNSQPPYLCIGSSITLTPQGGSNYSWTSSPSGASGTGSITVSPAVNTTYYLAGVEPNCGTSTNASVTILVSPPVGPVTITSGPTTFCQSTVASSTYTATAANLNYLSWSMAPAGAGTIASTGVVTWNSSFSGQATISVAAYSASNCNHVEYASRVVTINSLPLTTPTVSPGSSSICNVGTTTITVTGSETGVNYQLFVGATPISGLVNGNGTINLTSNAMSSSGTITVRATNPTSGCTALLNGNTTLTVNSIPGLAGGNASPNALCGSGTVTWSGSGAITNEVYRWYSVSTLGSPITPLTSISSTSTYYVSRYNSVTTCEGPRTAVTATVNPAITTAPTVSGNSRFGAGPLTLVGQGNPLGSNYKWYNSANAYQTTAPSYPISSVSASATNFMFAKSVSPAGCEGPQTSINVTIYPLAAITAPQNNIVKGEAITMTTGSGYDSYTWKNSSNSTVSTLQTHQTNSAGSYTVTVTKGSLSYTSLPFSLLTQFDNLNMNYIITNVAQVPNITDPNIMQTMSTDKVAQSVVYFDGLGRPIQSVATQSSPNKNDLIAPIIYDQFGREVKKYLPVVSESNGRYKANLFDESGNYLVNTYSNTSDNIADDTRPYAETLFEPSPLNRPDKEYGAGLAWSTAGSNKFIQHGYKVNAHGTGTSTTQEKIISWTVSAGSMPVRSAVLTGYIVTGGYYDNGQLNIKSTKDEQGNEVREYANKFGQVILKKVQATTAGASNLNDLTGATTGWALTYYVYDDLGNLRFVLPPELSKLVHTNADTYVLTSTDLNNWAFQYSYDGRKRMITKQVPGAGSVYMVYDNRDRLVLTQDANQRVGAPNTIKYWTFTKYDELNRPILTGIKDTTIVAATVQMTQAQMQGVVDTYYNNMTSTTWRKWSETYVGSVANNVHGYTNKAYPVRTGAVSEVDANKYLSVTYYDNYDFRNTWGNSYNYRPSQVLDQTVNGIPYSQPLVNFDRISGQITGTKVKVSDKPGSITGGGTWLKSLSYFDDRYRLVQSGNDNYEGGVDWVTNLYDFSGKLLATKSSHKTGRISWKDVVGLKIENNILISTGSSWGSSGAASTEVLTTGSDGWVECVASEINTNRMVGLSAVNVNANYNTINYAFYFNTNSLNVHENGVQVASIAGSYNPGDILRVERIGTNVYYKRNGIIVYSSLVSSTTQLIADVAFLTLGGTLKDLKISFNNTPLTITRRFEYDHAGRLLKTWHKLDPQPEILLALNEYNELGQLVDKKLHSTVSTGSNAKQSVDYRYNIRGWLTKMNEADVFALAAGENVKDYFGFELAYNNDLGTGNASALQYNGNISAMKWSNSLSLGTVKENAFNYTYDPLNRIKTSAFKEKAGSWTSPANSALTETGFSYDLNGNILTLQRNDKRTSGWMDNLAYHYGTGGSASNKLLRVTDSGDAFAGFIDGQPAASDDYRYDANGNLINDLNKGVGTSLADNTNIITYNYLNLPETVTKGGNSILYIYDAAGRKLSQVTTFGGQQKQTDYVGEFQYENDALQFISHEEGRIAIANTKTMVAHAGDVLTDITAATSTLATVTLNGSTYVRATANGTTAKQGMFPIGGTLAVVAGEQYRIRAKGYRTGANAVYLYIRTNSIDLNWPGAQLANSATTESYAEQVITIPAGHTILQAGVVWNTVTAGQQFFLNDFEITKLTTNAIPEYQYNLKDHLGNVRLTFTTKDDIETTTATLESANLNLEQSQFLRINTAKRVNSSIFDRTNGSAPTTTLGHAQRLNGSGNEKYGVAKSISVMPGDVINAEVYAKYVDPVTSNWTGAFNTLMGQIAANTAGVVIDGAAYINSTSTFPLGYGVVKGTDTGGPKAYLNWLIFDRNFGLITGGFKQMGITAKEAGTDVPHERVFNTDPILITQPGYVYIYLSNESPTTVEVYFDDFKVTHTKSPVIQQDDYYPFGLTFNSYQRENSTPNQYKFNGKEEQDELGLDWLDYGWRMYMPEIGRWGVIDGHADSYHPMSPYNYCVNNPINLIDLFGLDPVYRDGKYYDTGEDGKEKEVDWNYVNNWLQNNDGIAATYSFKSNAAGNAEITETKEKGKDNSFFLNGNKFTANSYATLMGRDDRDNSVGAFSSIYTMSESDLVTILGHGSAVIYDLYKGGVELATLVESIGGKLDYKNKAYDILGINRNALIQINGVVYNANEAGNFLWGMVLEYHGAIVSPNTIAELGTRGRKDEPWEQKAISAGRQFGASLTSNGNDFKRWVLQRRLNARADGY